MIACTFSRHVHARLLCFALIACPGATLCCTYILILGYKRHEGFLTLQCAECLSVHAFHPSKSDS